MKANVAHAASLFARVRGGLANLNVAGEAARLFRIYLCGDAALVAGLKTLLLATPDGVPYDALAANAIGTFETLDPRRARPLVDAAAKAIVCLARPGEDLGARLEPLRALRLPIFALVVDPAAPATTGPVTAPLGGDVGTYVVPVLSPATLRSKLFPHLVERCKHVEVAVGRRLPILRETVASKITRDAAMNALKISATSAIADNVPLVGIFLGAAASAGDVVAITGVQVALLLQIGAVYGKEPDVGRVWELLPIVGGGLGWRALSRQLVGFVPVAGVAVKGAIAYAGTIAVGESAAFFYEQGRHMSTAQAAAIYEERRRAATGFARETIARLRGRIG